VQIDNRLSEIRSSRGLPAAQLAALVGVRRQTIYAIEAGTYLPNTELALKLALVLSTSVNRLFSLPSARQPTGDAMATEVIGRIETQPGSLVRMCRVGERWIGIPVSAAPYYFPVADGIVTRSQNSGSHARVTLVERRQENEQRLVIAGCDPAALMLARLVEQATGVRIVPAAASSRLALQLLRDDNVHIAGSHLEDTETGEFNLPFVRDHLPLERASVITLGRWEAGLVVAAGNPKAIRNVTDLVRPAVTFVNREAGSGSRVLLAKLLKEAGITLQSLRGSAWTADGHLAAAYRVACGDADVCLATRSAARSFGLGFVPIQAERYDFVIPHRSWELPMVQTFLDVLQTASIRRQFAALTTYDTADMGRQVAS
jgi:molybdate-binding protein/DNA-binding XRE family transcriptional regulator